MEILSNMTFGGGGKISCRTSHYMYMKQQAQKLKLVKINLATRHSNLYLFLFDTKKN